MLNAEFSDRVPISAVIEWLRNPTGSQRNVQALMETMPVREGMIETASGQLCFLDSCGAGFPVLLVHGNSFCKDVFARQLAGPIGRRYRLIALDLPGHGDSDDAADPAATYSVPGYARACAEALERLGIDRAVIVGWSLGGHVALELACRCPAVAGVMMVGAPPFSHGILGMMRAFHTHPLLFLATKARLSAAEARLFARLCLGSSADAPHVAMILRTDPRARQLLFRSLTKGAGEDQKRLAESLMQPLAIVNGSREPLVRSSNLQGIDWANLWEGRCHVIEEAGHAPFLQAPQAFDALLARFVDHVATDLFRPVIPFSDRSRFSA